MSTPHDRAADIEAAWARERPDLDASSIGVVTRVWQLAKVFGDARRGLLASYDIEPALMDLLGALRRSGEPYELTTRELAARSQVTPAAISQRLTRAEQRGWVERHEGAARSVIVNLTAEGRDVVDRVAGAIFAADDALIAGLDDDRRAQLADLLAALLEHVDDHGPLGHVGAEG